MELLSPIAPLYPWLDAAQLALAPIDPPFNVSDLGVDCRDILNRIVVLQVLAAHGIALPWALGGIWSPLTDEQAGRVVAETIRRVGEDPGKPVGVVPVGVRGPYQRDEASNRSWREIVVGEPPAGCWSSTPGEQGEREADEMGAALGALLWEQITSEVKT